MRLRTKLIALTLVLLFIGSLGAVAVSAEQGNAGVVSAQAALTTTASASSLSRAPINPAWTQYQKNVATGNVAQQAVLPHGLGEIPPVVDLSPLKQQTVALAGASAFPTSYDLRALGKVSPVEDQGSCGSCWTFATYGSLESYLLPAQLSSFSENNLKNEHGFDTPCCNGGDMVMSTAYLARWGGTMQSGPVATACDPYTASCSDTTSCSVQEHVQNVYFLPLKQSPMDNNNAIKSALMTYGGVYSAFDWLGDMRAQTTYWNPSTAAYYDSTTQGGNHAVTIVGWDDSFPATSFSTAPPGNGAWICKNSWGTSWGQSGYFYISYYDLNMGSTENAVFSAEPVTNYAANYQYDPLGWVGSWGGGSSTLWGANVFTAQTGNLKAVGLYAVAPNMQYTIQIYTDPANTPTDGTLVATQSGSVTYAGYYTIPLGTTIPLTSGHKFAVVIEFTTPGYSYPLPTQEYKQGYSSNVINSPGQSYYSTDGSSWSDWYKYAGNAYVVSNNIKAFATTAAPVGVASGTRPAVCTQDANSLDLFVKGTDGALWHRHYQSGFWGNWDSLGGYLTSSPAAVSSSSGVLDVFVRGGDGALYWKHWNGAAWSGWASLGGYLTSDPAVVSQGAGKIDVFVRGGDGALWQREYSNGAWGSWSSVGGRLASGTVPAATSWGAGRLDVFVEGMDLALWHQGNNGAWSGWESLGGVLTSSPAAASPASGKIDVFVRGADAALWQREYSNNGWQSWTSLGGM